MTNGEIEKNKQKLAEVNREVNKEMPNVKEQFGSLIGGIKKLQDLADIVCAKKYLGTDLKAVEQKSANTNYNDSLVSYFREKIVLYEEVYEELSRNIYYVLHTEEMFNACVSAKHSCAWAALAAIVSFVSMVLFCLSMLF